MDIPRHRIFVSYHHANDQSFKNSLVQWNKDCGQTIFEDLSVDTGGIDDTLSDQAIRQKIRDDYLRSSTVTVLLVGNDTKRRKHVDWELYSSCLLYTSPSPRDRTRSRMPSSA